MLEKILNIINTTTTTTGQCSNDIIEFQAKPQKDILYPELGKYEALLIENVRFGIAVAFQKVEKMVCKYLLKIFVMDDEGQKVKKIVDVGSGFDHEIQAVAGSKDVSISFLKIHNTVCLSSN